jgi:prepilin-type N-terminal cleavage/methylation domain-containing protein
MAGFTLIELIIAITLAALISVMVATVLRQGIQHYERGQLFFKEQQGILAVSRLLRLELTRGAVSGVSGDDSSLRFETTQLPQSLADGQSGKQKIELRCSPLEAPLQGWSLQHQLLPAAPLPGSDASTPAAAAAAVAATTDTRSPPPAGASPSADSPADATAAVGPTELPEPLIDTLTECRFSFLAPPPPPPAAGTPASADTGGRTSTPAAAAGSTPAPAADGDNKQGGWVGEWKAGMPLPWAIKLQIKLQASEIPPLIMVIRP